MNLPQSVAPSEGAYAYDDDDEQRKVASNATNRRPQFKTRRPGGRVEKEG